MSKKHLVLCALLLGLAALGTGACGKEESISSELPQFSSAQDGASQAVEPEVPGTEDGTGSSDADPADVPEPDGSGVSGAEEASPEPEEEVKKTKRELKLERLETMRYRDDERSMRIIGFKSYKELKSERYEDQPEKGKVYLVLFLEIQNERSEKLYFNPYHISARIDGEEAGHSVLWNQPEGYPTIFANVEPGQTYAGFVTWQAGKDWKELHVEYDGFFLEDGEKWAADFTKEDFLKPDAYELTSYGKE